MSGRDEWSSDRSRSCCPVEYVKRHFLDKMAPIATIFVMCTSQGVESGQGALPVCRCGRTKIAKQCPRGETTAGSAAQLAAPGPRRNHHLTMRYPTLMTA